MKKLIFLSLVFVFTANGFPCNNSSAKLPIEAIAEDCIDEARSIAFYMMETHDMSEDDAAELVLLLIEGC